MTAGDLSRDSESDLPVHWQAHPAARRWLQARVTRAYDASRAERAIPAEEVRAQVVEALRVFEGRAPANFKFNRQQANDR